MFKTKLQAATEIRESLEIIHPNDYPAFFNTLFPVFYNFLNQGTPQFEDGPEQKLRNIVLEILSRLHNNELLRPYASNLLKSCMLLLDTENEENAVVCLRIIIDLHKSYRPTLEGDVQLFLDIVQKIYAELPKTVNLIFGQPAPQAQSSISHSSVPFGTIPTEQARPSNALIKSIHSFKVLTECPIIVVLLFQLYPRFLQSNIPKFMPLIVQALGINPLQINSSARSTHRTAYVDFIATQVKTLSFLAYLLRSWAELLKPYQETIPKFLIQLLLNCPSESAATRKDLLIATRTLR
eukprot:TRINITY_DN10338_c0_g1_i1.p1 TRINITY_DN10338_c0_g1~~TRINITY_DN10338_c0_g1_i1.p1  ORF type:complete len:295 (+),score=52.77 TRINITY_DN10338_c0_g1_i1:321-1205(+)